MNRRFLLALAILVPATAGAQEPRATANRAEGPVPSVATLRSQVESLEATNRDLASRLAQVEGVVSELRRFREAVLFAIEPELRALRERIGELESVWAEDYAEHRHSFTAPPFGWGTKAVVDLCTNCLIPYVSQNKVGKSEWSERTTSVPE